MSEVEVDRAWDVIVLGAGPVGEVAADRVRKAGLTVAVVEQHLVGGECSFYACSPSKALLRPVHVTRASQRVEGSVGAHLDRDGMLHRRDQWINDLSDFGAVGWLEHVGIDLVRGSGRIVGERRVEVDGTTLEARHAVVVATGTSPLVPDIPGLAEARPWTNREATTSSKVPDRLAVLGGDVVACERALVHAALG
jgi:dihydrolipoamide dehydrogenase